MAVDINGYNSAFRTFVDFAQKTHRDGYDSAAAKATLNERQLTVSALSLHETSYVLRKTSEKDSNDATRQIFRQAIIDMFGGEANIPASVKKAMVTSDYDKGRPLTARRIIAVKNAIDADGAMRLKGASQFREPATREAALGMGYHETELAKLARAVNFYAVTQNCTEMEALNAVSEPGSKANRLMQYGGRFLDSAENFADGLRLLDLFAAWHENLSTYVTALRNATPMRSRRDYSSADTLTKLNAEYGYVTPECRASHERFVFEALACDPKANLKATDGEEIFGVENNSATSFVCQGFGASAWNTIAQMPPDKRAVVFKAFDRLCIMARDAQAAKTDVGVRTLTVAGATIALARMIKNIDRLAELDARGRLTAKNIVAMCFPDLHISGRYETAKLHNAFQTIAAELAEDGGASLQIQKILNETGCTVAEARAAYYGGVNLPTLPYISSHQMELDGLGNIDSARNQLNIDLARPQGYSKLDVPLLDANHAGFRIAFIGGESFATGNSQAGRESAQRVVQKIENLCGRVHSRQAASVMSLLSQSGLYVMRGGLKPFQIHSTEHSAVDFTLSKDDATGDVTIRYSSPKELKFAFEWTATVKLDGSVSTTPMRFTDENTVSADVAAASANLKARFANVLPEEAAKQGPAIDKLLESAKTDRDLLAFLQKGGDVMIAQRIMLGVGNRLLPDEEIAMRLEALRGNINELRAVAKGDRRLFDTVMRAMESLDGKALKPGMITKMCEAAKKVDIKALKNISPHSSPVKIAEALCAFEKGAIQMIRETGILAAMGPGIGGAGLSACYALGLSLVCLRLEEDALHNLQAGLNSSNSSKVSSACELLFDGEFPDGNTRPENVRAVISNVANSLGSHFASLRQGIDAAISNVLGHEFVGEIPGEEQITDAEFASIYKVIEKSTLEVHHAEIARL